VPGKLRTVVWLSSIGAAIICFWFYMFLFSCITPYRYRTDRWKTVRNREGEREGDNERLRQRDGWNKKEKEVHNDDRGARVNEGKIQNTSKGRIEVE
jgi:hypothetical protein